jgi:shikimate kinase
MDREDPGHGQDEGSRQEGLEMMAGKAATKGAATVVNAIACGRGSAFGISLEVDASLELYHGDGSVIVDGDEDGAGLVGGCVRATAASAGTGAVHGRVRIGSEIPVSRGLKSSSAVSNVVVLATARAISAELTDEGLLDIAIDESIRAGVTVTGAFDDAAACFYGGLVITDNQSRRIIGKAELDSGLTVVIHVPGTKIAKSTIDKGRFEELTDQFEEALDLVANGAFPKAMYVNSKATATALDLSDEAPEAARRAGAYAAGITGTGPASVALCRRDRVRDIEKAFSRFEGHTLRAELNTTPSREVSTRLL